MSGKLDLLWGPMIMVNYENGGSVRVFFGYHSSPVDGFHCRVVICGYVRLMPFNREVCTCPMEPNTLSRLCGK